MDRRRFGFVLSVALCLPSAGLLASSSAPLVVHEWGTFTSLQDEEGRAIGGINTDDEPAPEFVHRLSDLLLLSPTQVPANFFQGAPACHPDVTLRLETPVIYFHPTGHSTAPAAGQHDEISVTAQFRGGWLTEFYPNAHAVAPGVTNNSSQFGPLTSQTVSALTWPNLSLHTEVAGPATNEHVWTAPRAVQSASVRTVEGEAEKFLFYRGVAHIDAPIAVTQRANGAELELRSQWPEALSSSVPPKLKSLWLVDIDDAGDVAFRVLPPMALARDSVTHASARFAARDYRVTNRDKLKASLQKALVAEGLFDDEAQALLNTWELSYFKSAGVRMFFMVPQAWTDSYLPLSIPAASSLTRVMVGRIELVRPAQRKNLQQLAQLSSADIVADLQRLHEDYYARLGTSSSQDVSHGRQSLEKFGVLVPRTYAPYLALGRFRNALILDEQRRRPTPALKQFIETYRLQAYVPVPLPLTLTPFKASGIYGRGERVGWNITAPPGTPPDGYSYSIRRNNLDVIKSGSLDLSQPATLETTLDEPAMVFVEIKSSAPEGKTQFAGAAVAPEQLQPSVERPRDFDAFWAKKIRMLERVPMNPVLTAGESDQPGVEYATLRMDHIEQRHIQGQVAKPKRAGKFPGLVIFQWASPPYPLQREWVTSRASEGWLTVNIEPHDVLPNGSPEYYESLPKALKSYQEIGRDDRERSYFLQMYLANYRAVEYLASRPDWDGKTLVVMGTSMGGQQSLCTAALNSKVTALIVHVPSGADANGPLHGRASGYPNWPANDAKAMATAPYFDTVNCASRIRVPSLVSMGFVDTTSPPVGIWTAFNQIRGPKEAAPMVDSPHNHLATAEQMAPFTTRSSEWLHALVAGREVVAPAH